MAGGLVAAVAAAVAVASRRRAGDEAYAPPLDRVPRDLLPAEARGSLAVLGFASRFCVACRRTPGVVDEAREAAGVDAAFLHLDVADHPDLVEALALRQTPTVVVVDAEGRVRFAGEGNPDAGELAAYLAEAEASPGGAPDLIAAVEDAVDG